MYRKCLSTCRKLPQCKSCQGSFSPLHLGAAQEADFARRGMGPNYLITKEGRRVLLVEEENMAWDYNLAFWGSGVVDQQGYIPGVGQINELKSYAISIQMESENEGKFADAQYDALNLLLKDVMARHRMQPWDVVSAGEVVQPPPKKPQPGPHFEWQRLDECCLHAKEFQAATLYDITELKQKLQEWGYAFGDAEQGFEHRLYAFRLRYKVPMPEKGYEFSARDLEAVESLLQQRKDLVFSHSVAD